jgi:hypothetical protein
MTKNNAPLILICGCNSPQHQIIIRPDDEDKLIYCHIHLAEHKFWKRFKIAINYILGYKSRYGDWEEFILTPQHQTDIRNIADKLEQYEVTTRRYKKLLSHFEPDIDLYSAEEWLSAIEDGAFSTTDGIGYWVKDSMVSDDEVFSTPQLDATDVLWFNK